MKKKEVFVVFLIFVVLIAFLFVSGVYNFNLRLDGKKVGENNVNEIRETEIILGGAPITIKTRTFEAENGFKVDYDIEKFDYEYKNDELRFVYKENQSIYVGIKEVSNRGMETKDTKFLTKNGLTFRIRTICDTDDSEIIERLKYLVDSIQIIK